MISHKFKPTEIRLTNNRKYILCCRVIVWEPSPLHLHPVGFNKPTGKPGSVTSLLSIMDNAITLYNTIQLSDREASGRYLPRLQGLYLTIRSPFDQLLLQFDAVWIKLSRTFLSFISLMFMSSCFCHLTICSDKDPKTARSNNIRVCASSSLLIIIIIISSHLKAKIFVDYILQASTKEEK